MITTERIQLNQRFVQVFEMLEARGDIVKNDRDGKGMGDFAERLLGNRGYSHIIRAFLNPEDRRVIDYHHARILCREYGINEHWMLHGKGVPFGRTPATRAEEMESTSGQILFTTTQAFAGASIGADSFHQEQATYFSLPGLRGSDMVAFPISGNSMEPVIANGDIVICKPIESLDRIRDNEIYAIKSNGAVWVKYIQKLTDTQNRVHHLRLISANYLEHDPFEEEVNEHTRVYKVVRRIAEIN